MDLTQRAHVSWLRCHYISYTYFQKDMYSPKTGNVSQVQPQCIFDTYHKYILDMYPIRCRLTKRLRIPYVQWIRSWNVFVIHIVNAECSGNVFLIRCGYISWNTFPLHIENILQLRILYMQWICSCNAFAIHILTFVV